MCFMPVRHVSRVEDAHGDKNPMVTAHWVQGCTFLPLKQLFPLIKTEYWDPAAGCRRMPGNRPVKNLAKTRLKEPAKGLCSTTPR